MGPLTWELPALWVEEKKGASKLQVHPARKGRRKIPILGCGSEQERIMGMVLKGKLEAWVEP